MNQVFLSIIFFYRKTRLISENSFFFIIDHKKIYNIMKMKNFIVALMSCITTLCQLFKAVALLIPIDNLPVKSTIFFIMAAILKIKMAATKNNH